MRSLTDFAEIFLHRSPVDMRKNIGGLSILAQQELNADWSKAQLFVFSNRKGNLLKILYFDHAGFALWTKKLDRSKFPWPNKAGENKLIMTHDELDMLLKGIDIWSQFEKILVQTVF